MARARAPRPAAGLRASRGRVEAGVNDRAIRFARAFTNIRVTFHQSYRCLITREFAQNSTSNDPTTDDEHIDMVHTCFHTFSNLLNGTARARRNTRKVSIDV